MLRGLVLGLVQIPDLQVVLFLPADSLDWLTTLTAGDGALEASCQKQLQVIPINLRRNRFVTEWLELPPWYDRLNLDGIIYPNYFTPWCWAFWRRRPRVVTVIHDLNYFFFPRLFSRVKGLWLYLTHRLTLLQADVTVTISEAVKRDVERVYCWQPRSPVVVIPNAILWERFERPRSPAQPLSQPFVLAVANHYRHKNLRTLLQAFCQLPPDLAHFHLVLVGQLPASLVGVRRDQCDDLPALAAQLGLGDRVRVTGYISDAELAWYYRQAQLMVFPSLFEGFGMPAVEALGLGLPVLTTRCTSLPEVTLNLAEYLTDPESATEMATRITEMLRQRPRFLPTPEVVAQIRAAYAPRTVAQRFVNLI